MRSVRRGPTTARRQAAGGPDSRGRRADPGDPAGVLEADVDLAVAAGRAAVEWLLRAAGELRHAERRAGDGRELLRRASEPELSEWLPGERGAEPGRAGDVGRGEPAGAE